MANTCSTYKHLETKPIQCSNSSISFCDPSPLLCILLTMEFLRFWKFCSTWITNIILIIVIILWCVFTTWWPKQKDCEDRGLFWGKICWNLPDLDYKPKQLHTCKETDQLQINDCSTAYNEEFICCNNNLWIYQVVI